MGLSDLIKNMFASKDDRKQMWHAKFLDGYSPIFSQFGQNIYASDVVQNCIDVIATECSKLRPRHIRIDKDGMQTIVNSGINRLFKFAPNELMTTKDFLEKIIWLLEMNCNAFIYPVYETKTDEQGREYINYTAFYPLDPRRVDFVQDANGRLFVDLHFESGDNFMLPYSEVIHLRKKFSVNSIMGGGRNGQPDNAALLKVLEINDTALQGVGKAVKTSLSVRGVLKINTLLDDEKQQAERDTFEAKLASGTAGILPMDLKGDYTPITVDPKLIDKDTMEFLDNKILRYIKVPMCILNGDFDDDQYQAFYEKTLEPLIISLGQAFSKCLFTQRELDVGNEIIFYQRDMMYLSTRSKLSLLKTAGEQGLLKDNQKLALLGYPPITGGERITQSLNFVDKSLINEYQMGRAGAPGAGAQEGTLTDEGNIEAIAEDVAGKTLNGAQTQSLLAVMEQYVDGKLTLGQAVNIISISIGVTKAQAKEIIEGLE
ncbi:MAG: phage portal protein [Desulfitobacterium sp.]